MNLSCKVTDRNRIINKFAIKNHKMSKHQVAKDLEDSLCSYDDFFISSTLVFDQIKKSLRLAPFQCFQTLKATIMAKGSPPISKFLAYYYLLKFAEMGCKDFMIKVSEDTQLIFKIMHDLDMEMEFDIDMRGSFYFSKTPPKELAMLGRNTIRLVTELIMFCKEKYKISHFDMMYESLKKKGNFPRDGYYFVNKELNPDQSPFHVYLATPVIDHSDDPFMRPRPPGQKKEEEVIVSPQKEIKYNFFKKKAWEVPEENPQKNIINQAERTPSPDSERGTLNLDGNKKKKKLSFRDMSPEDLPKSKFRPLIPKLHSIVSPEIPDYFKRLEPEPLSSLDSPNLEFPNLPPQEAILQQTRNDTTKKIIETLDPSEIKADEPISPEPRIERPQMTEGPKKNEQPIRFENKRKEMPKLALDSDVIKDTQMIITQEQKLEPTGVFTPSENPRYFNPENPPKKTVTTPKSEQLTVFQQKYSPPKGSEIEELPDEAIISPEKPKKPSPPYDFTSASQGRQNDIPEVLEESSQPQIGPWGELVSPKNYNSQGQRNKAIRIVIKDAKNALPVDQNLSQSAQTLTSIPSQPKFKQNQAQPLQGENNNNSLQQSGKRSHLSASLPPTERLARELEQMRENINRSNSKSKDMGGSMLKDNNNSAVVGDGAKKSKGRNVSQSSDSAYININDPLLPQLSPKGANSLKMKFQTGGSPPIVRGTQQTITSPPNRLSAQTESRGTVPESRGTANSPSKQRVNGPAVIVENTYKLAGPDEKDQKIAKLQSIVSQLENDLDYHKKQLRGKDLEIEQLRDQVRKQGQVVLEHEDLKVKHHDLIMQYQRMSKTIMIKKEEAKEAEVHDAALESDLDYHKKQLKAKDSEIEKLREKILKHGKVVFDYEDLKAKHHDLLTQYQKMARQIMLQKEADPPTSGRPKMNHQRSSGEIRKKTGLAEEKKVLIPPLRPVAGNFMQPPQAQEVESPVGTLDDDDFDDLIPIALKEQSFDPDVVIIKPPITKGRLAGKVGSPTPPQVGQQIPVVVKYLSHNNRATEGNTNLGRGNSFGGTFGDNVRSQGDAKEIGRTPDFKGLEGYSPGRLKMNPYKYQENDLVKQLNELPSYKIQ